jgi:hypothetical protein
VKRITSVIVMSSLLCAAAPAFASEPPLLVQASAPAEVPLKVQVVLSRYSGEKKISSTPYTLAVVGMAAGKAESTKMRMGVDVPIPQTVFSQSKDGSTTSIPQVSYQYRSVGTSMDCKATIQDAGVFKLDLTVTDNAVMMPDAAQAAKSGVAGAPSIRNFTSSFSLLLKDGQTAQHTAATDPVSGEVLRVDVTLVILK